MAANRHLGRIVAMQALYEYFIRSSLKDPELSLDDVCKRAIGAHKTVQDKDFVRSIIKETVSEQEQLDEIWLPFATNWPLEQIPVVEVAILRLATHELKNPYKDVPPKVAIDEAVELAKQFGGSNAPKFVNGVLGSVYKKLFKDVKKAVASSKPEAGVKSVKATKVKNKNIESELTDE